MPRRGTPPFTLRRYMQRTWGCDDPAAFRLCGMDEVGRGAFAGPLVAAAVVLPHGWKHPLLKDSKLLTARQREHMAPLIRKRALGVAVMEISAHDINLRGLGWANVEIFRRLVDMVEADGYCCDGRLRIEATQQVHCLVKGDSLIPAVSAASIVAKVHRDAMLTSWHDDVPHYNWASNKGYGAPEHLAAIRSHGPHPQHRNVFIRHVLQMNLFETTGTVVARDDDPDELALVEAALAAAE
ncbi:MAG TPA: ribonuclease HII [Candidatus Dormibacteraeota bacterium]|nr:ribonuclease HII [Candidatus Dormibacteraeota bacterium]